VPKNVAIQTECWGTLLVQALNFSVASSVCAIPETAH
jgi:hypothetical protein